MPRGVIAPGKTRKKRVEKSFGEKLTASDKITMNTIAKTAAPALLTITDAPAEGLIKALNLKDGNTARNINKISYFLLKLLCQNAVIRTNTELEKTVTGLNIFPLTPDEVELFTKLANTALKSKQVMQIDRKLRHQEEMDNQGDCLDVTPVKYSESEIDALIKLANSGE